MSEAKKKGKVIFGVPSLKGPTKHFQQALEASVPLVVEAGWEEGTVEERGNAYISNARAAMLRKAMDAKADIMVFLDYDLSWEPGALLRLIEMPGDVVCGTYRFKDPSQEEYMGELQLGAGGDPVTRPDGCLLANRAPAGFLKITKHAVHRYMGYYPELCYGERYAPTLDLFNHGAHEGVWWGEDYAFCRRWRAKNEGVWIIPDLNITHWDGDTPYPGNLRKFIDRIRPPKDKPEVATVAPPAAPEPAKLRCEKCGEEKEAPGKAILGQWVCDPCYYGPVEPPAGYGNKTTKEAA